jgi:hypothetical protein
MPVAVDRAGTGIQLRGRLDEPGAYRAATVREPRALLWRLVMVAVGDLAQDVVHHFP